MPDPSFDPSSAVTFDFSHGLVRMDGAPARLLVPADALVALLSAAGAEATAAFARSLGEGMGRRVAGRLSAEGGAGALAASVAGVVDHLGGELALAGLGSLSLERWGKALVLVVDHSPLGASGDRLLEVTLAGALEEATGKPARALVLARDAAQARFLIGSAAALDKVRAWLEQGVSWGEALVRLHSPTEPKAEPARGDA